MAERLKVGSIVNTRAGVLIKQKTGGVIVESGWLRDGLRPRHFGVKFTDSDEVMGFDADELEMTADAP